MTAFSFIILPRKSSLIEKDRFNKHAFVKNEGSFYIFARQQTGGCVEGSSIIENCFEFIRSIAREMESSIYMLVKELKNNEGENDFSIKEYSNSNGTIDRKKALELKKDTVLSYGSLYISPGIESSVDISNK